MPTKAKMTATLDFTGADDGKAPEWKNDDTVKFTSSNGTENLDLTFKYSAAARSNGWTKSEGTVPEGWTADFNGTTLTLEQKEASTLSDNPFGNVTTVVTADGVAVSGVTVGKPSWTPGVAGDSNTPDPEPGTPTITDKTPSADKTVNATVDELATKTLTVVAESSDSKPIAYAWKLDGAAIANASANSIKLSDAGIAKAGTYVVTCDLTSDTVTTAVTVTFNVTVTDGDETPSITDKTEESAKTLKTTVDNITGNCVVSAEASDGKTLVYTWKLGNTTINGETDATLSLSNSGIDAAGEYTITCEVTSETVSTPVVVTFTVTVAPEAPTWTDNSSEASVSGKTVTVKSSAQFEVGTYKLYIGEATEPAGTVELSQAGSELAFTNIENLTTDATNFKITITVNSVESAPCEAVSITPAS